MRRKQVSRRLGSLAEVRTSLRTHRGHIGGRLDVRYIPATPEGAFSYQSYFDHMDQELAKVETGLIAAEDVHVRNLIRIVELRRNVREVTEAVYDKQVAGRRILAGLYGKERDFELAAVEGATPQTSRILAEQVDQTIKLLRNPGVEVPEKAIEGVDIDFETVATDLQTGLTGLGNVRADLDLATKAADGTRQIVYKAIEAYDRVFPWVAQNLEGLFRLVGEFELADRIRTSARRVTRRQGDGGEEANGDTPDASEPAENEANTAELEADEPEAAPVA
ncbi:MAG: hypothetical protein GY719_35040 [bacterium]|nr:hypothetical protein [bacterium]